LVTHERRAEHPHSRYIIISYVHKIAMLSVTTTDYMLLVFIV